MDTVSTLNYYATIIDAYIDKNKFVMLFRLDADAVIMTFRTFNGKEWEFLMRNFLNTPLEGPSPEYFKIVNAHKIEVGLKYKKLIIEIDYNNKIFSQKDIWLTPKNKLPVDTLFQMKKQGYFLYAVKNPFLEMAVLLRKGGKADTVFTAYDYRKYYINDAFFNDSRCVLSFINKKFRANHIAFFEKKKEGWTMLFSEYIEEDIENSVAARPPDSIKIISEYEIEVYFRNSPKKIRKIDPVKKTAEWVPE